MNTRPPSKHEANMKIGENVWDAVRGGIRIYVSRKLVDSVHGGSWDTMIHNLLRREGFGGDVFNQIKFNNFNKGE